MKPLAVYIFVIVASFGGHAQALSGNDLHELCVSSDGGDEFGCEAYIFGLIDGLKLGGLTAAQAYAPKGTAPLYEVMAAGVQVCAPERIKNSEYITVAREFLKQEYMKTTLPASTLVWFSWRREWPCEKSN